MAECFRMKIYFLILRMLNTGPTGIDSRTPDEVTNRFALAIVAAKLLAGDDANVAKWDAVDELSPQVSPELLFGLVLVQFFLIYQNRF